MRIIVEKLLEFKEKAKSRHYPAEIITDVDDTYNLALLANTPSEA